MNLTSVIKIYRNRITKYYRIAVYSYIIPFIFLGVYLIDSSTFELTNLLFFGASILSLLPLGVVGLIFTIKGLILSFRSNDYIKKDIGYANLIMGIIMVGAGLIGLGFAYLMW